VAGIRLITFDLDNTLWDVGHVIRHAESRMNAWLDERVPEYRRQLNVEVLQALRAAALRERPEVSHDVSALREEVLYRGMRRLGLDETQARAHAAEAFQTFYRARQQVVFFEHALESLADLAGRYRLAALTNGNANVASVGLDRYFSFALSAADVRASKPAPDIFHAALAAAGVAPEESIHVGDNLVDDVHGASAVGMHTIWVNLDGASADGAGARPSEVVEHLRDLPVAVGRIHRQ
jgi:2-haloalkanoic acid dehalogenase type II